ncbi:MAG: ATP-binding protein [Acidimicrobiales bacterium]
MTDRASNPYQELMDSSDPGQSAVPATLGVDESDRASGLRSEPPRAAPERTAASIKSAIHKLSFRTRLGSAVALAVGLTLALAALGSYYTVKHQLFSQADRSLQGDLSILTFSQDGVNSQKVLDVLSRTNGGFVQYITSTGQVLYNSQVATSPLATSLAPTRSQTAVAGAGSGYLIDTVNYRGAPYRVITAAAQDPFFPGLHIAVQVTLPLASIYHTLSTLRVILWLVTVCGVALSLGIGYLVGLGALRPVARLTKAAEHVAGTQDLQSTIPVTSLDELGRLATAFNSMLAALASSRQQQAQLISDAGHELRTPLTSLRTNIEVLLRAPDLSGPDRAELTADVQAQMQELTNLVGDLVDLARHEERQAEPIEVRLDAIVEHAVERAQRRAPGLRFDLHVTPGSVKAQPALLERAVLNVLDNAAKWSPPEGTIEVWLQRGSVWALDIHDYGPGIADEDIPHVFDRFYRAATARSMPGSGLGLAIVAQVVADHGGTVSVSVPAQGGTHVHIELPTVPEDEADPETMSRAAAPGETDRPSWEPQASESPPAAQDAGRHLSDQGRPAPSQDYVEIT